MTFEELAYRAIYKLQAKGVNTSKIEVDVKLPYSDYHLIRSLINYYISEKSNKWKLVDSKDLIIKDTFSFMGIKINLIEWKY